MHRLQGEFHSTFLCVIVCCMLLDIIYCCVLLFVLRLSEREVKMTNPLRGEVIRLYKNVSIIF